MASCSTSESVLTKWTPLPRSAAAAISTGLGHVKVGGPRVTNAGSSAKEMTYGSGLSRVALRPAL